MDRPALATIFNIHGQITQVTNETSKSSGTLSSRMGQCTFHLTSSAETWTYEMTSMIFTIFMTIYYKTEQ